jgi:hypothetical protein
MTGEIESSQARAQKLEGLGTRRKRVEDVRFTQGKGNYVDDLKFPGILFGDFVRSPYGHARIKPINKGPAPRQTRSLGPETGLYRPLKRPGHHRLASASNVV